jgi:hypothetical protein
MDDKDIEKFEDADKFETMDSIRTEEFYTPPSNLKFPEEVKERFKANGFYLKWINRNNVRKRMHPSEGFVFAQPDEFESTELLTLGEIDSLGDSAIITNGDLVLMKVRIEKAEARRKYYENRTASQAEAIERRLRENAIEHGGSKSVVRTGKTAHFTKGF